MVVLSDIARFGDLERERIEQSLYDSTETFGSFIAQGLPGKQESESGNVIRWVTSSQTPEWIRNGSINCTKTSDIIANLGDRGSLVYDGMREYVADGV